MTKSIITKQNKNKSKKKPTPFYAPGSTTPVTQEELEIRKRRYHRMLSIGIDPTLLVDVEHENPYRVEAMLLINKDKEIPKELLEKIKKYDEEYKKKTEKK